MPATGIVPNFSGLLSYGQRPLVSTQVYDSNKTQLKFVKVSQRPFRYALPIYRHIKCLATGRSSHQGLSSSDGFEHEPFWLSMIKDVAWSLRSLAFFLAEQPSQLKFIEWSGFQSTLKTATLTLALVAFLIVALCSIDSSLYYLLALMLRKTA